MSAVMARRDASEHPYIKCHAMAPIELARAPQNVLIQIAF
jgi:hypothetical protein